MILKLGTIHINAYHEQLDGVIVLTLSHDYETNEVSIMFQSDGRFKTRYVSLEEYKTFKLRNDLKDFPDSIDPVLPYDFDLYFDIKRYSDLKDYLERELENVKRLKLLMKDHGIKMKDLKKVN